jgi:hypothetical protein
MSSQEKHIDDAIMEAVRKLIEKGYRPSLVGSGIIGVGMALITQECGLETARQTVNDCFELIDVMKGQSHVTKN